MRSVILYISYDGLLEPLGQSQVWQYLRELAKRHKIFLISFEKEKDWNDNSRRSKIQEGVAGAGVRWFPLTYHKSPSVPATAFDILQGFAVGFFLCFKHGIQIVHARSYVAAVIALFLKAVARVKFIFDMRGFWADERVDADLWKPESGLYRVAKWFERKFLCKADAVVSLTDAGKKEILKFPFLSERQKWIEVIPTCTNLEIFSRNTDDLSANHSLSNPLIVGYVGTVSGWYLFEPVIACFREILERRVAKLVIVNKGEHSKIRAMMLDSRLPEGAWEVKEVSFNECAREMRFMGVSFFFIKPVFSKKASTPTKLGELLGCGVPVLTNSGVGDLDSVIEKERIGVIIKEFSNEEYKIAIDKLLALLQDPSLKERCVQTARKYFSLKRGVETYDKIYTKLTGTREK